MGVYRITTTHSTTNKEALKRIVKGHDQRLPEKRAFADFRSAANAIKGKRFYENGNIGTS